MATDVAVQVHYLTVTLEGNNIHNGPGPDTTGDTAVHCWTHRPQKSEFIEVWRKACRFKRFFPCVLVQFEQTKIVYQIPKLLNTTLLIIHDIFFKCSLL